MSKKWSKSKDNSGPCTPVMPYIVSEKLGALGCRCNLDERDGINHLRYTGEISLRGAVMTTRFACRHGQSYLKHKRLDRKVSYEY